MSAREQEAQEAATLLVIFAVLVVGIIVCVGLTQLARWIWQLPR